MSIANIKEDRLTDQVLSVTTRALAEAQAVSIRVVRTVEEIEQIRDVWSTYQRHPNADIDFYLLVCRLRPEILRPHVIVLYRKGCPEAMLVGRIVQGTIDLGVGYGKILKMPARLLTVVWEGLLGDVSSENGRALVVEVSNALRRGEADAALFNFVRTDSPVYPKILGSPGPIHRDYFPTVQPHWSMKLPSTMEEVYQGLSRDHRSEIRRKAKKLLADHSGNLEVRCLRDVADLDRIFKDGEEIAAQTYQRGLGVGFIDSPEMRERFRLEAEKGWLRSYFLYVDNKPSAFWMGTVYQNTFHSHCLGYGTKHEKYSPGTYLLMRMIEDFLREGVEEVDFGLGDARYKQRFGNCNWQEASAYMFAPRLAATAINAARTPTILADRIVRRVLSRTKLPEKIKKIWRGRLRQS